MTPKERMLTALRRGTPDRVPATIHQWLPYHRHHYLDGIDDLAAFRRFGLDAALSRMPLLPAESDEWVENVENRESIAGRTVERLSITTPGGTITAVRESDEYTSWMAETFVKEKADADLIARYMPVPRLDRETLAEEYRRLGDDGIMRGFVIGNQGGPWQDACFWHGTERMILATFDDPGWVHHFLEVLTEKKLQYAAANLPGAEYDLIATGGGAASSTVISPKIFEEFCLPYDSRLHKAVHDADLPVVYHTCGGMMPILELIVENGCEASETLSPPGVGGDARPAELKARIGDRVCLIGGLDQFNVLTDGDPRQVRDEVRRLFEAYGPGGGYIMSTSDHFFHTPAANIQAYAEAAAEMTY